MTNTAPPPRLIQFPHPGFEYARAARAKYSRIPGALRGEHAGIMGWKPGRSTHDRKYMVVNGSITNGAHAPIQTETQIGFWGEWEAPSHWQLLGERTDPYHPTAIHTPLLPGGPGTTSRQNTDPLVLGGPFRYTNCKMYRRPMQGMPPGSMVLFGRGMNVYGEPRFVLDTCFVVEEWEPAIETFPEERLEYGRDLLDDVVVDPLRTEKLYTITPYRGRAPGSHGLPFSFFPAVRHADHPLGFRRPEIRPNGILAGRITETLKQGLKGTELASAAEAVDVWNEVVEQVLRQGCELGVYAQAPAPGSLEAALKDAP